jgi:hypothetical protein
VCVSWHLLHRPRPRSGSSGSSPRSASSLRSSGWWSATVLTAMSHSTQMGSRVSTAALNLRCPVVPYGLPSGLRLRSAWLVQLGQRPCPWCSSGQVGLVHTRHALAAMTSPVSGYLRTEPITRTTAMMSSRMLVSNSDSMSASFLVVSYCCAWPSDRHRLVGHGVVTRERQRIGAVLA